MPEKTGAQRVGSSQVTVANLPPESLTNPLPKSYKTYREMRKHPTLALARRLCAAPVVAAEWSVETSKGAPRGADEFIKDCLFKWRSIIVERAMLGGNVDFGWQPFEVVYEELDGAIVPTLFKPLLHDITEIMVQPKDGSFAALKQQDIIIEADSCLMFSFGVEGTNWYGESLLENARLHFNEWTEANAGASRYDKKLAGSHIVVGYPIGSSPDANGAETDNATLAASIIAAMQASGAVAIPNVSAQEDESASVFAGDKFKGAWTIAFMSDKGIQASFIPRLEYLDRQLVRALIFPERAILEGRFGTKAEAGVHQDLALTHSQLLHQYITMTVNQSVVRRVMRLNYGPDVQDTVYLSASPLADTKLDTIKELYLRLLENPAGFAEEFADVNMSAMRQMLGIPEQETAKDIEPDLTEDERESLLDDLGPGADIPVIPTAGEAKPAGDSAAVASVNELTLGIQRAVQAGDLALVNLLRRKITQVLGVTPMTDLTELPEVRSGPAQNNNSGT